MLEHSMQVAVVEAVSIGLVDEAKGAEVRHDDIWYLPPILQAGASMKQFVRILRGFLSCLEKANSPFFELFHTLRPLSDH